jgi:hypothetical protein
LAPEKSFKELVEQTLPQQLWENRGRVNKELIEAWEKETIALIKNQLQERIATYINEIENVLCKTPIFEDAFYEYVDIIAQNQDSKVGDPVNKGEKVSRYGPIQARRGSQS